MSYNNYQNNQYQSNPYQQAPVAEQGGYDYNQGAYGNYDQVSTTSTTSSLAYHHSAPVN